MKNSKIVTQVIPVKLEVENIRKIWNEYDPEKNVQIWVILFHLKIRNWDFKFF